MYVEMYRLFRIAMDSLNMLLLRPTFVLHTDKSFRNIIEWNRNHIVFENVQLSLKQTAFQIAFRFIFDFNQNKFSK